MNNFEAVITHLNKSGTPATPPDVAKALGLKSGQVSAILSSLYANRKVKRESVTYDSGRKGFRYTLAPSSSEGNGAKRRRHRVSAKSGVLITLQYGKKDSATMPIVEARQVYDQLRDIFEAA